MDITHSENWADDLAAGEDLLWQGRPAGRFVWPKVLVFLVLMLGVFTLLGLRWLVDDIQTGSAKWLGSTAFVTGGLALIYLAIWTARREHYYTFYALSNRRAFLAYYRPIFGRRVRVYDITKKSPLKHTENTPRTGLANVSFAVQRVHSKNGVSQLVDIGFRGIDDGAQVFALLQDVQRQYNSHE